VNWTPIKKDFSGWPVQPNLPDLQRERAAFSGNQARGELDLLTASILDDLLSIATLRERRGSREY
jgi:hypothetical protein